MERDIESMPINKYIKCYKAVTIQQSNKSLIREIISQMMNEGISQTN